MKQGKKPTRRQLDILKTKVATPGDWLVCKVTQDEMHLVHRYNDKTKVIWLL